MKLNWLRINVEGIKYLHGVSDEGTRSNVLEYSEKRKKTRLHCRELCGARVCLVYLCMRCGCNLD